MPERLQHADVEPATGATEPATEPATERHRSCARVADRQPQSASKPAAGERVGPGGDVAQPPLAAQPAQHGPDRHICSRLHQ